MAASGYTPISLYYSSTAAATPVAGNLVNGELAINITDGKLYYKDNAGVVQVIADKAGTGVKTISFGTTGLTPSTATNGAVTVAGTLITSNGGTGLSSYTAGDLMYYASGTALSKLAIGTANYVLTSSGTAPQWVAASSITVGAAGSNTQVQYNNSGVLGASSNFTFDGTNIGLAGGTANGVAYLNGSKVLTTGSTLTFDGTNLGLGTSPSNFSGYPSITLNGTSGAIISLKNNGTEIFRQSSDTSGTYQYTQSASQPLIWGQVSSELMRLTSTGLGIGTSSPVGRLTLQGAAGTSGINQGIGFQYSNGTQFGAIGLNNSSGWLQIMGRANAGLTFHVNSDLVTTGEAMRLDSSGNLGLGVTPSAWASSIKVLQLANGAAFYTFANNVSANVSSNFYFDGGSDRYYANGLAARYTQTSGGHYWYTAPSGTAGNAITFTQAMTLDASGNLIVGGTSAVYGASGRGVVTANGSSSALYGLTVGGADKGFVFHDGTNMLVSNTVAAGLLFQTSNTERMRIDSSGNVGIGTSSPNGRLQVDDASGATRIWVQNTANASAGAGLYLRTMNGASLVSNATLRTDNAGNFGIYTGTSSEALAMTIGSSGNVGIGTSSPSCPLDVNGQIRNASIANANPYTQARITAYSDPANWGYIAYGSDAIMRIVYANTTYNYPLAFGTTSANNNTGTFTETHRLTADGSLILKGGNTSATGTGITFPATQNASSDANTLDDYEEGSWTPSFYGSGGSPTITYTAQEGKYVKVGGWVFVSFVIAWSASSGGSGILFISGLPFATSFGGTSHPGGGQIGYGSGLSSCLCYADSGQTRFVVMTIQTGGTIAYQSPANINSGGGQIMGTFGYYNL